MSVQVLHGDCRRVLAGMPDGSVDSVVTDPPYELGFMGKAWDSVGVAYDVRLWAECLRVLKPGGHLLAFGGTRTYHRMAVAIEDVGFEIRDSLHWCYGSGFPKSLDVSKAIDKAAGAEREVVAVTSKHRNRPQTENWKKSASVKGGFGMPNTEQVGQLAEVTAPATDAARQWSGFGTALKPAHEPIVVARKPLVGTVAGNVLAYGTGALNIDGCRVGYQSEADQRANDVLQPGMRESRSGFGGGYRASTDPAGRWPANLVFTHAADCGDECVAGCPVAELDEQSGVSKDGVAVRRNLPPEGKPQDAPTSWSKPAKRDSDMGYGGQGGASRFFTVTEWDPTADVAPFRYVAKPSKRERNAGLDGLPEKSKSDDPYGYANARRGRCHRCVRWADTGEGDDCSRCGARFDRAANEQQPMSNHHPTVKPVALMRWLVRLVTPPGGTVLDPFAGSGTTLVAATLEGFDAIGIEMTDDYLPIIAGRVAWAEHEAAKATPSLFDLEAQT